MKNVVVLCLVYASLASAGFFTPSPEKNRPKDDVRVDKEKVVIGIEDGNGNTKVKISPHEVEDDGEGVFGSVKEKIKEVASDVVPEMMKKGGEEEEEIRRKSGPGEKIGSYIGRTKEAAEEAANEAAEKGYEAEEAVKGGVGKVKEKVGQAAQKAYDKARGTKESVGKAANEAEEEAEEAVKGRIGSAKDSVAQATPGPGEKISSYIGRTKEAEEAANEAAEKGYGAEEAVKGGVGKVKEKVGQATQKAYDKARGTKESVGEAANEAEDEAREAVKGRIGSAKDSVAQATRKVVDKAKERAEDAAGEMKEGVKGKAKEAEEKLKKRGKEGIKRVPFSSVLHLLGFATAYGMCVWVTFGSSYVLAKALPRQQLAVVQSRMYPVYFKAMASSVGMALVGYLMGQKRKLLSPFGLGIFRGFDLLASFLMILANLLYLEARATKVLFERMRKEKEEGGKEGGDASPTGEAVDLGGGGMAEEKTTAGKVQNVRNLLGRLNSYSSLLNVMTLMSLSWHLVHLGHNLHAAS